MAEIDSYKKFVEDHPEHPIAEVWAGFIAEDETNGTEPVADRYFMNALMQFDRISREQLTQWQDWMRNDNKVEKA